jgi:hypothetical protein
VEGIRQGKWKLLIKKRRGKTKDKREIFLFDLENDLGETNNLSTQKEDLVIKLEKRMLQLDLEIAQNARPPWFK